MSKTARTPYKTKKIRKTKGRASSASSEKQCVRRGGAMDSSEQTVVLSRLLNVDSDGDEVTSAGRLFHTR